MESVIVAGDKKISFTFKDICKRSGSVGYENNCSFIGVVDLSQEEIKRIPASFYNNPRFGYIPVATFLGGRVESENSLVKSAAGLLLQYSMAATTEKSMMDRWEEDFLKHVQSVAKVQGPSLPFKLAYEIEKSEEEELSKSTSSDIKLLIVSFVAVMAFTFIVMHSFMDKVASKAFLSFAACGAIGMAIGSSFGLMGYSQVKFNPVVAFVTFLLLGLGVDDSFVMVQAYHYTAEKLSKDATVKERMELAFRTAGVSMFFTSLTDFLAFAVGATSNFPAVQGFCAYAAAGVAFMFVYQLLFVGAFMALDAHREYSQVAWYWSVVGRGYLWPKLYKSDETPSNTNYVTADGHCRSQPETELLKRIARAYGRAILEPVVSAFILILFAGYLAVAVYGAATVGTGLDIRDLAASDSYWTIFISERFRLFNDYGPLYLIAFPSAVTDMSLPGERVKFLETAKKIEEDACFTPVPQGVWLRDFQEFVRKGGGDETLQGDAFYSSLSTWLQGNGSDYLKDMIVELKDGKVSSIKAFRIKVRQIPGTTTSGDKVGVPCMKQVRKILDETYPPNKDVRPLTINDRDSFVFWEGSAIIVEQTVLNLIYAVSLVRKRIIMSRMTLRVQAAACFVVTVIIIPHPVTPSDSKSLVALTFAAGSLLPRYVRRGNDPGGPCWRSVADRAMTSKDDQVGTLGSMSLVSNMRIETISMIDLVSLSCLPPAL